MESDGDVNEFVLMEVVFKTSFLYLVEEARDPHRVFESGGEVYTQRPLSDGNWYNVNIRKGRILGRYNDKKEAEKLMRQYRLVERITNS